MDKPTSSSSQSTSPAVQQRKTRHTWVVLFVWTVALVVFLYFFSPLVLVGLLLLMAGTVAAMLLPVRARVPWLPTWLAGLILGLLFWLLMAAALAGLGWLLSGPVQQLFHSWPTIRDGLNQGLAGLADRVGYHGQLTVNDLVNGAMQWLGGGRTAEMVANVANQLGVAVVAVLLIVFGSVFLLTEPPGRMTQAMARLLPSADRPLLSEAFAALGQRLRWWLFGALSSVTVVAIASALGFYLVGLDFWLPMGIMVGVAAIVPTLGPAVAFLLALLYASTQGVAVLFGVAGMYLGVQLLESYALHPWIMKQAVNIPPIVTLFTIVLWGRLFGPLGIVLAIPIDLALWSAIEFFLLRPAEDEQGEGEAEGKGG